MIKEISLSGVFGITTKASYEAALMYERHVRIEISGSLRDVWPASGGTRSEKFRRLYARDAGVKRFIKFSVKTCSSILVMTSALNELISGIAS